MMDCLGARMNESPYGSQYGVGRTRSVEKRLESLQRHLLQVLPLRRGDPLKAKREVIRYVNRHHLLTGPW
jgi:hypothetical protein